MSVIPTQRLTDVRPTDYAAMQRNVAETKTAAAAASVRTATAAGELNKAAAEWQAATRDAARRVGHEGHRQQLLTDPRQILRHMYRAVRSRAQGNYEQNIYREDLEHDVKELLEDARRIQRDELETLAERRQQDAFLRYVTLLEASERVGADAAAAERIEEALEATFEKDPEVILAGFNTAGPLRSFAKRAKHFAEHVKVWDQFRRLYGLLVIHGEPLATTFGSLLEEFGPERLKESINTLRGAIRADLASPVVSADPARLEQLQSDLERTHTMSSLLADGDTFCRHVAGAPVPVESVVTFVKSVFFYVGAPAYSSKQFDALVATLVVRERVAEPLRFQVRQFLKTKVPLTLWQSDQAREQLFPPTFRR